MNNNLLKFISKKLNQKNMPKASKETGGDINQSYKLEFENISYFLKINSSSKIGIFQDEFQALKQISQTNTIKTPTPIICDTFGDMSFLVMEFLNISPATPKANKTLGIQLANLHSKKYESFGFKNTKDKNWANYFAHEKLIPQIKLADKNNAHKPMIQKANILTNNISDFLDTKPYPSLVHGDLWGGNFASIGDIPVIYDMASYYAHREVDIAMSELFGGFSNEFYSSYNEVLPLEKGYETRKIIYNLYHILNHYNLFKSGYDLQANSMLDEIL